MWTRPRQAPSVGCVFSPRLTLLCASTCVFGTSSLFVSPYPHAGSPCFGPYGGVCRRGSWLTQRPLLRILGCSLLWLFVRVRLVCLSQGGLLFLGMLFLAFGEGMLRVFFAGRVDAKRTFFLGVLRERRKDPSYWLALFSIGIACCRTASLTTQGLVLGHTGRSVVFFLCVFSHSWILAFQVW